MFTKGDAEQVSALGSKVGVLADRRGRDAPSEGPISRGREVVT